MFICVFESQMMEQSYYCEGVCKECQGYLIEDPHSGDVVCYQCGIVSQQKVIILESMIPNNKLYNEDPYSNHVTKHLLTYEDSDISYMSKIRNENQFLWDGLKDIEDVISSMWDGENGNMIICMRAKELFHAAFVVQKQEKEGIVKRKGCKSSENRKKYAKRKQFVLTAIYRALRENNITRWSIADLNNIVPGRLYVKRKLISKSLKQMLHNQINPSNIQERLPLVPIPLPLPSVCEL